MGIEDLDDALDQIEEVDVTVPETERPAELVRRAEALPVGAVGRAEFLACAAEGYAQIGEPDLAEECINAAVDDGGPTTIDIRAWHVDVLLAVGKPDEAADVAGPLLQELAEGNLTLDDAHFLGEAFEANDQLDVAHRWFTVALRGVDPDDTRHHGHSQIMLIQGRARVRRVLGHPADRFDTVAAALARSFDPDDLGHLGDGPDLAAEPPYDAPSVAPASTTSVALIFWPEPEFAKFVERWPDLAEGYGGTFVGHRALMRENLAKYAAAGTAHLHVSPGNVEEFLAFAAARGMGTGSSSARSSYAAEVSRLGLATTWPPGRNDPCWCGSGKKYKKCCGAPGIR